MVFRLRKVYFLEIFFLLSLFFFVSVCFGEEGHEVKLVSAKVINPDNGNLLFSDSANPQIQFSFKGFEKKPHMYLINIVKPAFYLDPSNTEVTISDKINTSLCNPNLNCYFGDGTFKKLQKKEEFTSLEDVLDFTLTYHLNQALASNPANFSWDVNKYDTEGGKYTIFCGSGDVSLTVTPGNPVVSVPTIYDINNNKELTSIGKNSFFEIRVNVKDNTDDSGKESLTCTATIGEKIASNNEGASWEEKQISIGPFNAAEVGVGKKTVSVVCDDGALSTTKTAEFTIFDAKPKENQESSQENITKQDINQPNINKDENQTKATDLEDNNLSDIKLKDTKQELKGIWIYLVLLIVIVVIGLLSYWKIEK